MLIIKVIQTFTSDNAYEPLKKAILAVPLQSRSAIGSHWPTTPSLLGRPMPPLSPLTHEVRGDPVKCTFLLLRLGKMNYWLLLTNKKFVLWLSLQRDSKTNHSNYLIICTNTINAEKKAKKLEKTLNFWGICGIICSRNPKGIGYKSFY